MKYILFPCEYRPYEEHLPEFVDHLPEGARLFAIDPDHYDFSAARCVKDLIIDRINYADDSETVDVEICFRFEPRSGPYPPALVIQYTDVRSLAIDVGERQPAGVRLGALALDEILPHEHGVSHELAFHAGTVLVIAKDLRATWDDSVF
ncbi:hypothetical protein GCM10022247_54400 [Allokutzneria multivorans]|uniref:Uncharacterized protein n=1 Tax=Allokutzneria multivorans TaxID=1142134 RepID=A0ABP7T9V5_9PSEU